MHTLGYLVALHWLPIWKKLGHCAMREKSISCWGLGTKESTAINSVDYNEGSAIQNQWQRSWEGHTWHWIQCADFKRRLKNPTVKSKARFSSYQEREPSNLTSKQPCQEGRRGVGADRSLCSPLKAVKGRGKGQADLFRAAQINQSTISVQTDRALCTREKKDHIKYISYVLYIIIYRGT